MYKIYFALKKRIKVLIKYIFKMHDYGKQVLKVDCQTHNIICYETNFHVK